MKILQFESVGGASGDMILGALIELGIDVNQLQQDLDTLPIEHCRIEARPCQDSNLRGTRVTVHVPGQGESCAHPDPHAHGGRSLKDIRDIISKGKLPKPVKSMSVKVFTRLAEAEALVHGTTPDAIHFHEVGALDSIVDIVGCCLGLERLGVDEVVVGPLPAGRGLIHCAHGTFPNPAPATVELLKGFPIVQTDEPQELVTPTGAALLSTWSAGEALPDGSRILRAGYSFGHRKLERRPNVLRATLFEADAATATDVCVVLECNIDDTVPELLGSVSLRLMEAGALDAYATAVQMKKQRPGTLLTVLCTPETKDALLDLIFQETTTFGVREYMTRRTILDRRTVEVQTPFGPVRIKIGRWKEQDVTWSPEMEDCVGRARERNVPVRSVYEASVEAAQAWRRKRPNGD
ncbi:MAG: nickel pincer cofactor biosynthesis protein LarC [Verrucomicrobiota bacterium]